MADVESTSWSATDASNTAATPDGAPNNFARTATKNIFRAIMGGVRRFRDRITPTLSSAGTAPAFTLTYTGAPTLVQGSTFAFKAHDATTGSMTLNVNSTGAKKCYDVTGTTQLAAGAFIAGTRIVMSYDTSLDSSAGGYVWLNQGQVRTNGSFTWSGAQTFSAAVTMSGAAINEAKGADIASATTTDIGAATGNYVVVTGTTTITGLGTVQAGTRRVVEFSGALTLTHNATSLILPGGANITTAAGDCATFVSEGSGNWRCVSYLKADGTPIAGSVSAATQANQETGTSTTTYVSPGRQQYHASAAKAWCLFDGTGTPALTGTPYNVSSITDNGTGDHTVNWTTAFSSVNYAVVVTNNGWTGFHAPVTTIRALATGSVRLHSFSEVAGAATDQDYSAICVAAFGDQ